MVSSIRPVRLAAALTSALLLVAITGFFAWPREPAAEQLPSQWSKANATEGVPGASEEKWMAAEIGREIAETIVFAGGTLPQSAGLTFTAERRSAAEDYRFVAKTSSAPEVQVDFSLSSYFWSPDNFVPWSKQLLTRWHVVTTHDSSPDPGILQRLTNPRPDVLIREDQRLSEALTKAPLDPQLHEEAALLLGSFILREAAGEFCDARREMCAMSAHLALARAIRGKTGSVGDLAEALLCVLCGRETPATEILARLQTNADGPGAMTSALAKVWSRALQTRNTWDYRLLEDPAQASLLERLEYFRALRASIGTAAAEGYLEKSSPERLAEWPTVILAGPITVRDGNQWARTALMANLEEAAAEYQSYFAKPIDKNELVNALNAAPEHFVLNRESQASYVVLGWGSWAGFRQRQLCWLIDETWYWLDGMLGASGEANQFRDQFAAGFSDLTLFPLVRLFDPDKKANEPAKERWEGTVQKLCREQPERISFEYWTHAHANPRHWFSPTLPYGTLFDFGYRSARLVLQNLSPGELEGLKELAPHNFALLEQIANITYHGKPTPGQIMNDFAPVTYQLAALRFIADTSKEDPTLYENVSAQICELDPDYFTNLGDYLVEHEQPEAAADAYQKAVDHATDRVRVSNDCRWLVDYYYDHGRRDDAVRIAQMAADIYSSVGLETGAHIMEREGRLDDAEKLLKQQSERYRESGSLAAFYGRHQNESQSYASEYAKQVAKIFPGGMQQIDTGSLAGAPQDGLVLQTLSAKAAALGLKVGNVIVAVNGTRVANMWQYLLVADSATDPEINFTVWTGHSYLSAKAKLPTRRLGVRLEALRR